MMGTSTPIVERIIHTPCYCMRVGAGPARLKAGWTSAHDQYSAGMRQRRLDSAYLALRDPSSFDNP